MEQVARILLESHILVTELHLSGIPGGLFSAQVEVIPMINLLKAEYYKLLHKQSFWDYLFFFPCPELSKPSSDGQQNTTSDLWKDSLYNLPQIYFISILFAALFIGEDFENRTISSFISAGHKRGDVFSPKPCPI